MSAVVVEFYAAQDAARQARRAGIPNVSAIVQRVVDRARAGEDQRQVARELQRNRLQAPPPGGAA